MNTVKNIFKAFDNLFIDLINKRMKTSRLDKFMFRVTNLGGAIFISLLAIGLAVFGNYNIRKIGIEAMIVLFISQSIVYTIKKILSRERPYKMIEHLNTFGISLKDYSFPSGHTTASFSMATTLALNIPRIWLILYLLALIIGISRIYLGVHYPTDVMAGIIIGIATSLFVHTNLLGWVDLLNKHLINILANSII